jgi:hypothetical protein
MGTIIRVIKLRMMDGVRNVATWDIKETYSVLNGNSKGKRHIEDLNVDGMQVK